MQLECVIGVIECVQAFLLYTEVWSVAKTCQKYESQSHLGYITQKDFILCVMEPKSY